MSDPSREDLSKPWGTAKWGAVAWLLMLLALSSVPVWWKAAHDGELWPCVGQRMLPEQQRHTTYITTKESIRPKRLSRRKASETPKSAITKKQSEHRRERQQVHRARLKRDCPSCNEIFRKLNFTAVGRRTSLSGNSTADLSEPPKRSQFVTLEERGEPNSGTSFMFEWAARALVHACEYLNRHFGRRSCVAVTAMRDDELKRCKLLFRPRRGRHGSPCSCSDIESVMIIISAINKHTLPVTRRCHWFHQNDVARDGYACGFPDGSPILQHSHIASCMEANPCDITADGIQMAVLRDPRAMAVDTFFYEKRRDPARLQGAETIDQYTVRRMPVFCQWLIIRYILFQQRLKDSSVVFWHDEALQNPLEWHHRFLDSIGLKLPDNVVENAKNTAIRNDFWFRSKGTYMQARRHNISIAGAYRDKISTETLGHLDAILRVWLPPVLLERLGVSLEGSETN